MTASRHDNPEEWIDILAAIGGPIDREGRKYILGELRKRQERLIAVFTGVKALVWLHYENYTDAVELHGPLVTSLLDLAEHADIDTDDVYEAIREAEKEINDAGGIVGSLDEMHPVRTPIAYETEGA